MEAEQAQKKPLAELAKELPRRTPGLAGRAQATLVAWAAAFHARVHEVANKVPATVGGTVSAVWESFVGHLPSSVQSRVVWCQGNVEEGVTDAVGKLMAVACAAKANAHTAAVIAQERACELTATAKDKVTDPKVQVTVAAAAGGAVNLGAGGGAAGLAGGGAIGAACGVVPAIFTFGLSIPIGAAIGAGTGLVVGTVVGGTAGLVGGGATGYGAYTKRKEIRSGAEGALSKAMDCSEYIQAKATSSKEFVKQTAVASAHTVRSRLCATTSGTE